MFQMLFLQLLLNINSKYLVLSLINFEWQYNNVLILFIKIFVQKNRLLY